VRVKFNFEITEFSSFSMRARISKIHNLKTIGDKKSDFYAKLSFFEVFNVISKLRKSKIFEISYSPFGNVYD
jgi:hypothetical protein